MKESIISYDSNEIVTRLVRDYISQGSIGRNSLICHLIRDIIFELYHEENPDSNIYYYSWRDLSQPDETRYCLLNICNEIIDDKLNEFHDFITNDININDDEIGVEVFMRNKVDEIIKMIIDKVYEMLG